MRLRDPSTPLSTEDSHATVATVARIGERGDPAAVQPVAMLRSFTEHDSYQKIGMLRGMPGGAVRGRLDEAGRQPAAALPGATADRPAELDQRFGTTRLPGDA